MGCCREKPRGTKKVLSIVEGWKNIAWSSDFVKKVAFDRAAICGPCDKNENGWCKDCGCWIPAKARSLSEVCEKWDEVDKNNGL